MTIPHERVAIIHDYIHTIGGAEKVVEHWLSQYPDADVYTAFVVAECLNSEVPYLLKAFQEDRIHTSFEQSLLGSPRKIKWFKFFTWLHPLAMGTARVYDYDKVLISSVYAAKHIRLSNNNTIICYSHSPAKFLYTLLDRETDITQLSGFTQAIEATASPFLRWLDQRAMQKLKLLGATFQTNSTYMQHVHQEIYDIDSTVVYPPINTEYFAAVERNEDTINPFYFCYGRISAHKRIDLAVTACLKLGRRLIISGGFTTEIEKSKINALLALHPDSAHLITYVGRLSDEQNKQYISRARALLYPGKEDFGIIPIEMMAAGMPVIAYRAGGALDYIQNGVNGYFFDNQTVDSLTQAIQTFERSPLKVQTIQDSVIRFSPHNPS